jgi:hypothetical protein
VTRNYDSGSLNSKGGNHMGEIKWERDFKKAIEKAKKAGKPIYHDFWLDG